MPVGAIAHRPLAVRCCSRYNRPMSARRIATYEDLCALPDHVTDEIVFGVLQVETLGPSPCPRDCRPPDATPMSGLVTNIMSWGTGRVEGTFALS